MHDGDALTLRRLVDAAAAELLAAAVRSGGPGAAARLRHPSSWSVAVRVVPPGGSLSPCERDALAVIRSLPGRTPARKVAGELRRRGTPYAASTVKHALARLVRLRLITSTRRAPSGYAPAGNPTEEKPAGPTPAPATCHTARRRRTCATTC